MYTHTHTYIYIHAYIDIYFLFSDSFPLQVITRYWIQSSVLLNRSLLFVCFVCSSVYLLIPSVMEHGYNSWFKVFFFFHNFNIWVYWDNCFSLENSFSLFIKKHEFNVNTVHAVSCGSWVLLQSCGKCGCFCLAGNQSRYVQTANAVTSPVCGSSYLSSGLQPYSAGESLVCTHVVQGMSCSVKVSTFSISSVIQASETLVCNDISLVHV